MKKGLHTECILVADKQNESLQPTEKVTQYTVHSMEGKKCCALG